MANEPQVTQATPPAAAAAEAIKPEVKVEKQTNCLGCSKPLKKIKRYYRDGKFYCSKTCWRNYITKSKEKKE
jgi:hypothetical protein